MSARLLLFVFAVVTLPGCTTPIDAPDEPVWGKQPCAHCAMLLSEPGHGAQATTDAGDRVYFDDLGCLVAWELDRGRAAPHRWVRSSDGQGWLDPALARFTPAAHTPMDFGFVAGPRGPASWPEVERAVLVKLGRP